MLQQDVNFLFFFGEKKNKKSQFWTYKVMKNIYKKKP